MNFTRNLHVWGGFLLYGVSRPHTHTHARSKQALCGISSRNCHVDLWIHALDRTWNCAYTWARFKLNNFGKKSLFQHMYSIRLRVSVSGCSATTFSFRFASGCQTLWKFHAKSNIPAKRFSRDYAVGVVWFILRLAQPKCRKLIMKRLLNETAHPLRTPC